MRPFRLTTISAFATPLPLYGAEEVLCVVYGSSGPGGSGKLGNIVLAPPLNPWSFKVLGVCCF